MASIGFCSCVYSWRERCEQCWHLAFLCSPSFSLLSCRCCVRFVQGDQECRWRWRPNAVAACWTCLRWGRSFVVGVPLRLLGLLPFYASDATCSDTLAPSHQDVTIREPGDAAAAAELPEHRKRSKYPHPNASHRFIPVAVEWQRSHCFGGQLPLPELTVRLICLFVFLSS